MVFLAVTRAGYDELRRLCGRTPTPIWLGDGVLTEDELKTLHTSGIHASVFTYSIDPKDAFVVEGALHTIAQHHPNETIWVERQNDGDV